VYILKKYMQNIKVKKIDGKTTIPEEEQEGSLKKQL